MAAIDGNSLRLLGAVGSGNTHKAKMILSFVNAQCKFVPVDLISGEQKTEDFRKISPLGQVPVLIDASAPMDAASTAAFADPAVVQKYGPPGLIVRDSCAILVYVTLKYGGGPTSQWFPASTDPVVSAKIAQWLSFSVGEINNSLMFVRLKTVFSWDIPTTLETAQVKSRAVLGYLEKQITARDAEGQAFLAANWPTIADVAVFPYIALTEHSSRKALSLEPYPKVRAWIARVKAIPGYPSMEGA